VRSSMVVFSGTRCFVFIEGHHRLQHPDSSVYFIHVLLNHADGCIRSPSPLGVSLMALIELVSIAPWISNLDKYVWTFSMAMGHRYLFSLGHSLKVIIVANELVFNDTQINPWSWNLRFKVRICDQPPKHQPFVYEPIPNTDSRMWVPVSCCRISHTVGTLIHCYRRSNEAITWILTLSLWLCGNQIPLNENRIIYFGILSNLRNDAEELFTPMRDVMHLLFIVRHKFDGVHALSSRRGRKDGIEMNSHVRCINREGR
jgi:hypothetical protein